MGGKTTSSTQSVSIPPEVLARYNAVNTRAEDVAARPFVPYSNDPNAFVAGLTPSQQAGIANINAAAGMSQPSYAAGQEMIMGGLNQGAPLVQSGLGQGQSLTNEALGTGSRYAGQAESAINRGMGEVNADKFSEAALQQYMNPYMKNVIEAQQALQKQEAEQQRSALSGQAIMSGAFGGDRGGIAQANLARQQSMANQATLSGLLSQGYGQALNTFQQQQGVNLAAGQANRAAVQGAGQQLAALGQQQYAQQAGAGQNLYNMGLGAGQALYGMGTGAGQAYATLGGAAEQAALNAGQAQMGAGQIQQQTDQAGRTAMYNQFLQQQGYPYQQAQFLANIAMGTGALSGSTTTTNAPGGWSDRRLKENIKKVGETYDGQNIYSYNFKGEKLTQLGLIAQEVKKEHPEAVGERGGYLTVDYRDATEDAAKRGHFASGGLVASRMGGAVLNPGDYATGGMIPSSPDENGQPRYVWSDDMESAGFAPPVEQKKAPQFPGFTNSGYEDQVSQMYQKYLGRAPANEAETDYWEKMLSTGQTPDQIASSIAKSPEAQKYTATQNQAVFTGIPTAPYQDSLKYDPNAFKPYDQMTQNRSGFYAAPSTASASSFSPQAATPGAPAVAGKGPSPMGAGTASGKGPSTAPATPPAPVAPATTPGAPAATGKGPAPTAGATTPPTTGGSSMVGQGKGPATSGYPGSPAPPPALSTRYGSVANRAAPVPTSSGAPTASGKGPVASMASGGRIEKQGGGGLAMLQQLAAQHAAQYGQMPGGPGFERIKHTVQQPSKDAMAALRSSGSSLQRPQTLGSSIGEAAKTGENIGKLFDMGKKAAPYVTGGRDSEGTRIPSIGERLGAIGKPEQGPPMPGGTTTTTTSPGASLDGASNTQLAGGKVDPEDWLSKNTMNDSLPVASGKGSSSFDSIDLARGGRAHFAGGGRAHFAGGGLPAGLAPEEGIDIPDEKSDRKLGEGLLKPSGGGGGSSGGGIGEALGTAASVASVATAAAKFLPMVLSMFSDERIKENKKVVGELFDGQKVYSYDFGDGKTQLGLMAQEVEKRHPDAVHEIDGIKMVNYRKATSKARPHKYGGGPLGLENSLEEDQIPPPPVESAALPVQLATRGDTMSDAPFPGLGAVRQAPMPTTGLVPSRPDVNLNIPSDAPQGAEVEVAGLEGRSPNFDRALSRTFKEEGGLNKRDTNGEPSLYGINRKYHPGFFESPSKEKAAEIYKSQYWDAIGADKLSPDLAHVAFDTAVIAGVEKAKELIRLSGGDPQKFLDLRKEFQDSLIEKNPGKYGAYVKAWGTRINNLRSDIASGSSDSEGRSGTEQRSDLVDGSVSQIRSPGIGGPGQGPMDKKSAPYLNILERVGGSSLPDEMKSSAFWRPLLAGVGSMLASNKPRFSQALGEGLVGAISASAGEETQEQALGASRANVEKVMSDIVGSSFKTENGVTFIRIVKSDGSYDWFPYNEWLAADPSSRPKVDPRVESIVSQMRKSTTGSGATKPDGAAAPAPAGTNTPAGTTTPEIPGRVTVRPGVEGVDVTRTPSGLPTTIALSKDQANTAARAAFEMAGSDAATKAKAEAVDFFDPQLKMATNARAQQQVLVPLSASFAALPAAGSISTSGKAQELLQPVMATLNNLASITGKPNLIQDPSILMNQEEVNKLVNQLQQGRLSDSQLRAVSAFKELAEGIPSLSTSPGGQYALMSKLLSTNMREIDKDKFFTDWQAAGRGDRGQYRDYVRLTSREANRAFDQTYTDAFYAAERQTLEKMFKDTAPDPKTGKPIKIMEYMAKYGNDLGDEEKKIVKEKYGPNVLRYFGIPQ
ncbi:Domain of unknown function DUF4214 [uncultured Caudovirales phage]|uniref:DUF4214 domain-containing protein n=1 Tax=uncultured Caudovirales phage TaxID=2100421 RepID=A0A6J5NA86_9CAUD|nr:Domain of unknown function DUF4214 [uncultured Caudovirales phage]